MIKTGKVGIVDGLTGLYTGDASPSGNSSDVILKSPALEDVKTQIDAATERLQTSKKVLIVDGLDALIAMAPEGTASSLAAEKLILSLREVCCFSSPLFPLLYISVNLDLVAKDSRLAPSSAHSLPSFP